MIRFYYIDDIYMLGCSLFDLFDVACCPSNTSDRSRISRDVVLHVMLPVVR